MTIRVDSKNKYYNGVLTYRSPSARYNVTVTNGVCDA